MAVPFFHADHVGSLLRPRTLTLAFRRVAAGEMGREEFRALQDAAISGMVDLQAEVGLEVATDGEFRRSSYWSHFVEAVEGLTVKESLFTFRDEHGHEQHFTAPHVTAKVRRAKPIASTEFAYLSPVAKARGLTPKVTLPSPPTMHFWRGRAGIEPSAYDGADAFFADLAQVFREEIAALARLGCTYVQVDEVPLAMLCDPAVREQVAARGDDPMALVGLYIRALNDALRDKPAGMTAAMHMCRGNYKGQWLSEGGYESVAEWVFSETDVDSFLLEYDTPRAGDFAPLRFLGPRKAAVLGLVSTKTPRLESIAALCRRIEEAAKVVPMERLAISPQCGFASTVAGNPVSAADQRRKLGLVVETARRMWS
ncbi:MAG TPA: 5-methyltetrahydropteroyltriglutamate--homocysteine S-methyltransferase [Stellaceae bacterium]|nr:5-methyltetrahydropteroyltriglutamate--homocysteine S-methyltransferase [Stellaceae bacterium]